MKRIISMLANQVFLTLLVLIFCLSANGQKLPNIQANSLRAPLSIKTDGKLIEWDNKLQAYNHSTNVFYTIANDDDSIYLIIQATDTHAIEKILSGGISFTLKNADKINKATPVNITYLFVPVIERMSMISKIESQDNDESYNEDDINVQLALDAKEIQVAGIKEMPGTLISVYNDYGIKAAARFDSKKALTYELLVPLKYLQQSLDNNSAFNYKVKLNAVRTDSKESDDMQDLFSPTDFSGTYALAK